MATLQGKAVKNTYRQVLQIGANNVGVSGTLQPVQDGTGTNTALSLSTAAATINGTLTITGDLIITGGGIQIQDLIDDTVASLIQNGTGITWAYNDTLRTLTPTITIATADGGVQGDFLQLNVNANEASAVGKLKWNTTDGTMDIGLMGGNVVLQVGQEQVARVVNNSGTILTEAGYQVVKIASAQGQRLAVNLAQANNDANSVDTLGLVTENIANNQEGYITTSGLVRGIDTTGDLQLEDWNDGDVLYLSPTTPGAITKVKPIAPNHTIIVGYVIYAHKNNGQIFVKVDNGYELDELHNVRITSVVNNNVLRYNSSLAVWENVAPLTTWITEGTNLYYTQGRFDSAFAAKSTTNLAEGTNLYFTTARGNANFATNLAASTTTNLAEGTNLYFTNQRFDSRFSTKTTTDLAEGTNLYYTQTRFNTAFDAKTTTDLDEGTNLYYTDARARAAISETAVGLDYSSGSGVLSLTAGYAIPTTVKLGQYDIAYNRSIVSAAVTGTSTKTLNLTQQDANVISATWTDQGITTINGTANQIAASTVGNTTTIGFTNDVTMPNNLVVSGNLTINGTATYVNTQSISSKDPLFEVANDNNTTDAVDIGYYGRYYDAAQTRIEFTGLFRDASDAGKFKFFTGLVDEPTNVVDTTGTGYTVGTLVSNVEGNLAGTANAANVLSTARSISATGDAAWTVNFDGSANATGALTLANTGVTATTYGTSTAVPTIAIDSKGRITSASNTNITFPVTTVNSLSGNVVLTTSNVAEGTNQYFTSARAQASITGAASSVVTADLTASRALVSDGTGKIAASASTTATELSYVAGVTSAIQTQLNTKALDSNTVHISGTETITGAKTFSATLAGTSATFNGIISSANTVGSAGAVIISGTQALAKNYQLSNVIPGVSNTGFSLRNTTDSRNELIFDGNGAATFSSTIAAATESSFTGTSANTRILITASGIANTVIGFNNSGITTTGVINNAAYVGVIQGYPLIFITDSTERLRIASTGDATFAGDVNLFKSGSNRILYVSKSDGTSTIQLNSNGASSFNGGNVLIGKTNDVGGPLQVSNGSNMLNFTWDVNGSYLSSVNNANTVYKGMQFDALEYRFNISATERMRITSGGDLGIGTSTIYYASGGRRTVEINGTSSSFLAFKVGDVAKSYLFQTGTDFIMTNLAAAGGNFIFENNGAERMRIASNGNAFFTNSVIVGGSAASRKLQVNTGDQDGIRISSSGSSPVLDLMQTAAANAGARNWRLLTNWEGWGTLDFQSGTNNTNDPSTTRLSISGTTGAATFSSSITSTVGNITVSSGNFVLTGGSLVTNIPSGGNYQLYVPASNNYTLYNSNVGNIGSFNYTTGVYTALSDINKKKDFELSTLGLDAILGLKSTLYRMNADKDDCEKHLGFIAQEVKEFIPQAYVESGEGEDKFIGLDYQAITSALVKAVQEQQSQIEELKQLIAAK